MTVVTDMSRIHDRHGFTIPLAMSFIARVLYLPNMGEAKTTQSCFWPRIFFCTWREMKPFQSRHAITITESYYKYICLMSFRPKNLHWSEITWSAWKLANISVGILGVNAMFFFGDGATSESGAVTREFSHSPLAANEIFPASAGYWCGWSVEVCSSIASVKDTKHVSYTSATKQLKQSVHIILVSYVVSPKGSIVVIFTK